MQNHVAYYYLKNWKRDRSMNFRLSRFILPSLPGPDSTAKFSRQVAEATSPHIPRVSLRYQGSKFAKSRKLWFSSWSWKAVGIIEFIRLVFIIPASIVRSRKGTRKAPSSPLSSRLFLSLSSHALFIIVDCTCHREWNSISICLEFSEYR